MRSWLSGETKGAEENRDPSKGSGRILLIPSAPGTAPLQQPPHTAVLEEASGIQNMGLGTGWAVPPACRITTMLAGVGKRHSSTDEESPVAAISAVLAGSPSIPSLVLGLWQHHPAPRLLTPCIPARAEWAGERRRFGRARPGSHRVGCPAAELRQQLPAAGTAG